MTEQVVIELLGEPLEKETLTGSQVWYYQEAPQYEADKIVDRPRYGFLMFKTSGDNSILYKWQEPDWAITAPHTEAQYLTAQKSIEAQRKREQARIEREKRLAERKAQREQKSVEVQEPELTEAEKQQLEQERQKASEERKAKLTQQLEETRERNRRKKAEYEDKQNNVFKVTSYKFWFSAGGLMLTAAVLLCFVGGVRRR